MVTNLIFSNNPNVSGKIQDASNFQLAHKNTLSMQRSSTEPLTIRQSWLVTQRCSGCVYVHVCVHLDGLNTEHKFWVWDTIHGHADLMTWTRFTSTATTCQCYGCHHIKINNNTSMKTNKETDIISYSHDLNTACKCEQYSLEVTPVRRHACQSQILTVCCQKNKNKFRKKYYQFWIAKIYMLLQYCSGK